jgi:hypothetical protein
VGKRIFSRLIRVGGARVITISVAGILAVMLGVAAMGPPSSGTAFAQDKAVNPVAQQNSYQPNAYTIGPVGHVQVEKKYDAVENAKVRFHGVGAGLTIHKPSLGNPNVGPEKASVSEIALFTYNDWLGRGPYAIELGWMVSPTVFGKSDNEPHLILGVRRPPEGAEAICQIRRDGQCGFHYVNNPYVKRNQDLWFDLTNVTPPVVNYETSNRYRPQMFHIGYYKGNNAWWIGFKNHWIGYIDAKWFGKHVDKYNFTKADYAYWYGEVLSGNGRVPCQLEMGNGIYGTKSGSARFTDMFYEKMDQGKSKLYYTKSAKPKLAEGDYPVVWKYWNGKELSGKSFSYGGPGAC